MRFFCTTIIIFSLMTTPALAVSKDAEIQFLLNSIGDSGCTFNRNGKDHSAIEAEDHLRMKYDRAGKRVKTAEAFIEHLASKSSWTGKLYTIQCGNDAGEPSGDWLSAKLEDYRQSEKPGI